MKKRIEILSTLLFLLLFVGCSYVNNEKEKNNNNEVIEENSNITDDNKITVWTTYWDTDNLKENIEKYKDRINNVNYFAAYFNENNQIYIPNEVLETKGFIEEEYSGQLWNSYITFVNDKTYSDGYSSLKDTELLYKLFENNEAIDNHVDNIINIAIKENFTGIEIDYEGIKNDVSLWKKYIAFIDKLFNKAKVNKIPLRILLEPSTPVEALDLPQGPEYIMMCYNLYGYGTGPGPKANKEFLLEMINKMTQVSKNRGYALATGGFDFCSTGKVKSITRKQAEMLVDEKKCSIKRDENSQYIVFTYFDEENNEHTVWYGDDNTLQYLENILRNQGEHNISIWRLGGNVK